MSEKLTRAEVEKHLETARQYAKANALGSLIDANHLIALCNMALGFLAMQPRPISEAPKDGTHILAFFDDGITPQTTLHWFGPADLPGLRGGGWYVSVQEIDSGRRYHPTHFIPLSSLPEPKE